MTGALNWLSGKIEPLGLLISVHSLVYQQHGVCAARLPLAPIVDRYAGVLPWRRWRQSSAPFSRVSSSSTFSPYATCPQSCPASFGYFRVRPAALRSAYATTNEEHSIDVVQCFVHLLGLSITISITELATGNMISGTTRIFSAIITTLQLGFGMTLGTMILPPV
jgi:hypothetical protein